jgi:hypothetical protein
MSESARERAEREVSEERGMTVEEVRRTCEKEVQERVFAFMRTAGTSKWGR